MKLKAILFPIVGLAALSHNAMADTKIYSGSMCQPGLGTQAVDFAITSGGIRNEASGFNGFRNVQCPFVRDVTGDTNGASSVEITLRAPNGERTTTANCGVFSHNLDGRVRASEFATISGGPVITRTFRNVNSSNRDSYYSLNCTLEPGATLLRYEINE